LLLSFGLTSREWESIVSGDRGINDPSIDGRQRDFPLLSRLPNITAPIKYQPDEVSELREECLKAASLARDQITVKGLDKLVISSGWAKKIGYGLVLVENEEGD